MKQDNWKRLLKEGRDLVTEQDAFTYDELEQSVEKIKKGIKAPYVHAYYSTLGGKQRPSILITFSLDNKKDWPQNILQNSRWVKLYFSNKGVLELNAQDYKLPKKFRKTKVKNVDEAIKKINKFIQEIS